MIIDDEEAIPVNLLSVHHESKSIGIGAKKNGRGSKIVRGDASGVRGI